MGTAARTRTGAWTSFRRRPVHQTDSAGQPFLHACVVFLAAWFLISPYWVRVHGSPPPCARTASPAHDPPPRPTPNAPRRHHELRQRTDPLPAAVGGAGAAAAAQGGVPSTSGPVGQYNANVPARPNFQQGATQYDGGQYYQQEHDQQVRLSTMVVSVWMALSV